MAEVKKVDKTAEAPGQPQNVAPETPPKDDGEPKTLAEARAKHAKEDAELADMQAKVAAEVAERDKNAKPGEGKPTKRTEREMARGKGE